MPCPPSWCPQPLLCPVRRVFWCWLCAARYRSPGKNAQCHRCCVADTGHLLCGGHCSECPEGDTGLDGLSLVCVCIQALYNEAHRAAVSCKPLTKRKREANPGRESSWDMQRFACGPLGGGCAVTWGPGIRCTAQLLPTPSGQALASLVTAGT